MPVTDFLERNVKLYGNETALVELNPEIKETRRMTWKEYDLIQPTTDEPYRREITWNVFNEKANRFANMLLSRGVKKGDKVAGMRVVPLVIEEEKMEQVRELCGEEPVFSILPFRLFSLT